MKGCARLAKNVEAWEIVEHKDDPDFLKRIIQQAGQRGVTPAVWNGALAACQVFVGLQIAELTKALGESAAAQDRHARKLRAATWALVLATLMLIVATVVVAFTPG